MTAGTGEQPPPAPDPEPQWTRSPPRRTPPRAAPHRAPQPKTGNPSGKETWAGGLRTPCTPRDLPPAAPTTGSQSPAPSSPAWGENLNPCPPGLGQLQRFGVQARSADLSVSHGTGALLPPSAQVNPQTPAGPPFGFTPRFRHRWGKTAAPQQPPVPVLSKWAPTLGTPH